jgi:hypothetical protein
MDEISTNTYNLRLLLNIEDKRSMIPRLKFVCMYVYIDFTDISVRM